jgi:hypothetical protein
MPLRLTLGPFRSRRGVCQAVGVEAFFNPAKVWPQGPQLYHIYYVPDLERLAPMLDVYEPLVAGAGCVEPIARPWIHATLCKITVAPAELPPSTVAALAKRLCARLAQLEPVELVAGPAFAGTSAVTVDLTPDAAWLRLRTAVTTEIEAELGAGTTSFIEGERPHLTLGHGRGAGESGILQSRMRRATDIRVPLVVDRVDLVEVTQDPVANSYTWALPGIPLPLGTR